MDYDYDYDYDYEGKFSNYNLENSSKISANIGFFDHLMSTMG
jgi:hypothetical protein